jgi:hypothetical protein
MPGRSSSWLARLTGRAPAQKGPDISCAQVRRRFLCDAALSRARLWWDWSRANGSGLRVSDGNRASSGDEASRHASTYDDLLPASRCGYASKPIFPAIIQDKCDRAGQVLQRRRLRLALAVSPWDLGAVGDIPGAVPLDYRRKLVSHNVPPFRAPSILCQAIEDLAGLANAKALSGRHKRVR